jgi:hypothetical protein
MSLRGVAGPPAAPGDPAAPVEPRKVPPAPSKLGRHGRHGRKLWREMTTRFDFEAWELVVLGAAARQRDDIDALEDVVREAGMFVPGSTGQPRLNPAVTEVRLARGALSRLLGELKLPEEEDPATGVAGDRVPRNARSRKAQAAAHTRWSNHRRRRGEDVRGG